MYKLIHLKKIIIVGSIAFIFGLCWYAYQRELIILNFDRSLTKDNFGGSACKRTVTLFYYKNNKFMSQEIPLLLDQDQRTNLAQLITRWLSLLSQENIADQKSNLQSVLINYDRTELFISFDKYGWNKDQTIFFKWMIIESLIKTIATYDKGIKKIRFLIDHKQSEDPHLDFSNSWPINGYLP